ncbi:ABC transporter G family member 23 [Cephus cinctus]|uniref:ABC transporter G family member 23 n=1 Tax=Cephus cinctus TaxID=211228 RepID=A0AAJ7C7Y7_CEPCN|nr:ABC transporter G family member 23 [Cephus cinctus]
MAADDAIVIRNARKSYGKGVQILDDLNMIVKRGSIYGLLGASGCGKTTLLSCVVGVRKLDSGDIWVLGGKPGTEGSGIPGPRVGYMPQEISLVKEFTVLGALYYFGRINGLNDDVIEERYEFLSDLLQLPPKNRLVKNMSGGQQRRVSFAAALVHKPELLILDEPTVGLDPVLCENIWNFLVKITREDGVTVVITTHYIEEAKQANKIGLMRCGQLLAESTPSQLLIRFQCDTLEEAFLTLSQQQKERQDLGITDGSTEMLPELEEIHTSGATRSPAIHGNTDNNEKNEKVILSTTEDQTNPRKIKRNTWKKFKALMIKNILQFARHPGGILFALIFPMIQVCVFFYSIGGDPRGLQIGVVNEEAGNCDFGNNVGQVVYMPNNFTCDFIDLSCRFIREFNDSIAEKKFYNTQTDANEAVKKGTIVGFMYFGANFSQALQRRRDYDWLREEDITEKEVLEGEIQIWLDMGNRQIGLHVKKKLFDRFFEIFQDIISTCNIAKKYADLPIKFENPMFGTKDPKYSTFMAPVFLLTVVFFLMTSVSSSIIIADRHEGVWDRSLVQGVTTVQILIAHILTQGTVVIIQVAVSLTISIVQFELECKGSMMAVISLLLLMGICGMCYGFFISIMCSSHTLANYIATGSFYPVILLCGCIWPVEGMPRLLRWISLSLPTTVPGIALRGLLDKGYTMDEPTVYHGFLVTLGWTLGLLILCVLGLRSKTVC